MGHQSCEALVPVAVGIAIDAAVVSGSVPRLLLSLAGLTLLFTLLFTCYRWFSRLGDGAVIDESHALRAELATRVLTPGAARRRQHGELLTIASSDADQAARSIIWFAGLFGAGAALAVSCAVLLSIDLLLGAVLIGTAVVVTLGLNALSPLISRRITDQQQTLAGASALATDLVAGLRVLHGLGAQEPAAARYRTASRAAEEAGVRAGSAKALQQGATVLAATVVLAVSVGFAGLLALDGTITVGAFVSAVGVAQFIAEPLTGVGFYLQVGAAAKASARRVRSALGDALAGPQPAEEKPAATVHPLDVSAGEFVGIVAGPDDVERVTSALRLPAGATVHVEPHHPDLFAGSIGENLALGRAGDGAGLAADTSPAGKINAQPTASIDTAINAAIDAAGARDFVDAQPGGLDARVYDRGLSLSGGQRQRLVLARALHTDADVLVLVEPTTAVDSVTEEAVADGIRSLRHHRDGPVRTTVVVTSSPVLLARADRVVLVDDGTPHTVGTHRELLDGNTIYRERVLR
ncbi:ABC transporter ATP-binding protein [Promicromonospora sukumoe]|uniref:Putative ABC transport system ATP-binding protein n=1 Tax=Promicromonospora sukumoe TaxID=88382 RepID=A0A7W3PDL6_9MICO|nr:ABC transporter ATP-binding protein [Promicromonospora sukumoe]MBA8807913.1 putative ABC transport system ATP-binding protein [Promicromonospora sukumoe]